MHFPTWVDGPRSKTKAQRASARLKWMLSQVAFSLTGKTGMRNLAPLTGLDQSLFYLYIRQGAFSATSATAIEKALGRKVIKAEYLTNPLDIEATA